MAVLIFFYNKICVLMIILTIAIMFQRKMMLNVIILVEILVLFIFIFMEVLLSINSYVGLFSLGLFILMLGACGAAISLLLMVSVTRKKSSPLSWFFV